MIEATLTMTREEMQESLRQMEEDDNRTRKVRLGWLFNLLQPPCRKEAPVRRWLQTTRFMKWWDKQRYGPSLLETILREEITKAIDAEIIHMYESDEDFSKRMYEGRKTEFEPMFEREGSHVMVGKIR